MNVIVALDDSPHSLDIVSAVTRRVWPAYTKFKVLTVIEPCDYEELDIIGSEFNEQREEAADKFCGSIREKLERAIPNAIVHYEVRHGSPSKEIINAAVDWSAELILLGAHGHRACPTNLMGSVSRAVAHHAPCSVEVVRAKNTTDHLTACPS